MHSAINRRNPSLSFPPFSEPLVLQFSIFLLFYMREFRHLNLLNNHFLSKGLCVIHHLLECAINYFKFSCLKLCSAQVIIFFNSKTLKSPVCKVLMKKTKKTKCKYEKVISARWDRTEFLHTTVALFWHSELHLVLDSY